MQDFIALMNTEVGKATVAKFADVGGMCDSAMRRRLQRDEALAAYFVKVVRQVVGELKAEAL